MPFSKVHDDPLCHHDHASCPFLSDKPFKGRGEDGEKDEGKAWGESYDMDLGEKRKVVAGTTGQTRWTDRTTMTLLLQPTIRSYRIGSDRV